MQELGVDYYGNDILSAPKPNVTTGEVCNRMCVENNECTHWTINSDYCYIKNSSEGRKIQPDCVSGNRCSHHEYEGTYFFHVSHLKLKMCENVFYFPGEPKLHVVDLGLPSS